MLEEPIITMLETEQDFLQSVLRNSECDPALEVIKVEATPGCSQGDNYMSAVTRVLVTGRTKSNRTFRKLVLLKRQPASIARRQAFRCDPAFRNEAAAYKQVLPSLREYSKSELPYPSCLYATTQLIILEDLQPFGFRMADRLKGLDFEHSVLALKELGRFHGTSLAMKHLNRNAFEKTRSEIEELIFVPEASAVFGASFENALNMALMSLEVYKGIADVAIAEAVHRMMILKGSAFQRLISIVQPSEPLSVICHGDFWINNMLFRYVDGKPEEVLFVDLQVARYASPALDILHFLTSSTENGLACDYHEELIQAYYDSLSETMKNLAPSAPQVRIEDINEEIEIHALYGLLLGFLLLPAVTAEKNNIVNLDTVNYDSFLNSEQVDDMARSLTPKYYERIKNLVLYFIDRGFI